MKCRRMLLSSVFAVLCLFGVCRGLPQFGLAFGISESPHIGPRLRFSRSYALQPEVTLDWSIGEVIGCEIGLTNFFYLPRERSKVEDYAVGGLLWGHVSKHYHRYEGYSPWNYLWYEFGYGLQYNFNKFFAISADMRASFSTDFHENFEMTFAKSGIGFLIRLVE